MTSDKRTRLQLGSLEPLLVEAAEKAGHGLGLAYEIRRRLADSLGVPAPDLSEFREEKPNKESGADHNPPNSAQAIKNISEFSSKGLSAAELSKVLRPQR